MAGLIAPKPLGLSKSFAQAMRKSTAIDQICRTGFDFMKPTLNLCVPYLRRICVGRCRKSESHSVAH
jgi:hypothetical protein